MSENNPLPPPLPPTPRINMVRFFTPLIIFIIAVVGSGVWAIQHIRNKASEHAATIARLESEGTRITTDIVDVIEDNHIRMNGHSPYRIYSTWTDPETGTIHKFFSGRIWNNPLYRLGSQKTVTVFLDPENPDVYYMDITSVGLGGNP